MSDARPDDGGADEVASEAAVRATLREVVDPETGEDVVAAGLVGDVDAGDGAVAVEASVGDRDAETADLLVDRMRTAILADHGVETASVEVASVETASVEASTDGRPTSSGTDPAADPASHAGADPSYGIDVEGVDRVVAVASAKGGVGKTTVATQLARGLAANGESVGLFDADVYGPNVPKLLDVEGPLESTAEGAARPVEADGIQVVSLGLIANEEPMAWRGAMANDAVEDLLTDAAWDADTLVIDLPPGTGDVVLTALQSLPLDGIVLVTTPFETAVADTGRSATLFREEGVPVLGTVVNMAGFTCPTCGDEHAPFGEGGGVDADGGGDATGGEAADGTDAGSGGDANVAGDDAADVLAEFPIDEELRSVDGPVPDPVRELAASVDERLDDADPVRVPDDALDLRGVPDRARIEQVRAEFAALAPGEALVLVTDREPGAVAPVLEDLAAGPPAVTVARKGAGTWAVRIAKPAPDESDGTATPDESDGAAPTNGGS